MVRVSHFRVLLYDDVERFPVATIDPLMVLADPDHVFQQFPPAV
jgi:hypothetical protein